MTNDRGMDTPACVHTYDIMCRESTHGFDMHNQKGPEGPMVKLLQKTNML